jgi:hypothetical protein
VSRMSLFLLCVCDSFQFACHPHLLCVRPMCDAWSGFNQTTILICHVGNMNYRLPVLRSSSPNAQMRLYHLI